MPSWPDLKLQVYIRVCLVYTNAPQIHSQDVSYPGIMSHAFLASLRLQVLLDLNVFTPARYKFTHNTLVTFSAFLPALRLRVYTRFSCVHIDASRIHSNYVIYIGNPCIPGLSTAVCLCTLQ